MASILFGHDPRFGVLAARLPAQLGLIRLDVETHDDYPFLVRLYRSTREDELAGTAWSEELRAAFCASQFALQHRHFASHFPGADFRVVRRGGEAIGRLYVASAAEGIHIIDIALLASARGQGVGTSLIRTVQGLAASRGSAVTLSVLYSNEAAQRLYLRLGFTPAGPRDSSHRPMRWTPS